MDVIKTKRTKSIKEKAQEVKIELLLNRAKIPEIYEAGANYVLEEIGRIVDSAIENKSMTIPTWRLNYIIKQLKK